jgi:hypothetical protein
MVGKPQRCDQEIGVRLAPASVGEGPAVNVAQLYAIIVAELNGGERCAPDFADALALRQLIARTAN